MTDPDSNPGATRANWREAPFSAYAFRTIDALLPVAPIAHAPNAPRALPAKPADFSGFAVKAIDGSTLDLAGLLAVTATDAIVVLKDGNLAYEAYFNGNSPARPHILMSATKSIAGLLAGLLAARGVIDLDAPVARYLPELSPTVYADATLRQLVDMRTAIELDSDETARYAAAANWDADAPGDAIALRAFYATLRAPLVPHGGPFRYISSNTDLLGWVMERASGKRIADLVSELIWRPMGAESDAFVTLDRDGLARCTGGICATARDLARLGQLVVDGGRRDGIEIVPQALIDDIAGNGDRTAWRDGEWGKAFAAISRDMSYRSGWYVIHDSALMFAMGIHGQNLFVDRANRLVIAKFSSQAERIDPRAMFHTHRAVAEFHRCLGG